jgi:hypothetical protein
MMGITLLDMLMQSGMLTPEQSEEALRNRVMHGGKIGTNLIELGFINEDDLARFLSRKLAVPYIPPHRLLAIPPDIIRLIPPAMALKYRVVPLGLEGRRLSLVMADPADLVAIEEISFITGYVVRPLVAPEVRLIQALGKYYQLRIEPHVQQIIDQIKDPPAAVGTAENRNGGGIAVPAAAAAPPPILISSEEDLEEIEVVADEELTERIERLSTDLLSKTLSHAGDREEIASGVLRYMGKEFDRGALFLARGEMVAGWRAVRQGEEIDGFSDLRIPLSRPSVLKTIIEGKSYYLGPLRPGPLNARIMDALGGSWPKVALLMPMVVSGRVVGVFYLEGGTKSLEERFFELQKLQVKTSLAFEILISRDTILMM